MKLSSTEQNRGVRFKNGEPWYNYCAAPIICRDSQTGRDLHRNRTGKFFLHTPGGTGVHSITPLTIAEAKEIVARDGTYAQYQELFVAPTGKSFAVTLAGQDYYRFQILIEEYKITGSALVRRLIREEAKRLEKKKYDHEHNMKLKTEKPEQENESDD